MAWWRPPRPGRMAAAELAELAPGAQGMSMVGTFLAEQVSNATFELVSVPFFALQRRKQAAAGRSPATPASARGRRQRGQEGSKDAVVLPALIPIDPLLDEVAAQPGRDTTSSPPGSLERRREEREARRATEAERVRRSASRLCRGDRCILRRPTERATPSDEDIMRSLTQPVCPSMSSSRGALSSTADTSIFSSPSRLTARRHHTYTELFRVGLAGTELACLPVKKRKPLVHLSSRQGVHLGENSAMLAASEVRILPEDPVEAFFKTEQAPVQESQERSAEKRLLAQVLNYKHGENKEDTALPQMTPAVDPAQHAAVEDPVMEAAAEAAPLAVVGEAPAVPTLAATDGSQAAGEQTEAPAFRKSNDFWSGIIDGVLPKQRMSPLRREACQLLRFFVFGAVGNENKKGAKEKERVLYEPIGTKDQVRLLYAIWDRLDSEGANCVDFQDFRQLAERLVNDWRQDRRPSVQNSAPRREDGLQMAFLGAGTPEDNARFVAKLCEKMGQALNVKKNTMSIEDAMRFLWPCAGVPELKQMKAWCEDFALSNARWRVATPKVCPPSRVEELKAVFRYFDKDAHGAISSEELVRAGLMDRETARKCFNVVDGDGSGELEMGEFCEIMCPTGFRANSRAETATTKDGERVLFDKRLQCWRLEDTSGRSGLP